MSAGIECNNDTVVIRDEETEVNLSLLAGSRALPSWPLSALGDKQAWDGANALATTATVRGYTARRGQTRGDRCTASTSSSLAAAWPRRV